MVPGIKPRNSVPKRACLHKICRWAIDFSATALSLVYFDVHRIAKINSTRDTSNPFNGCARFSRGYRAKLKRNFDAIYEAIHQVAKRDRTGSVKYDRWPPAITWLRLYFFAGKIAPLFISAFSHMQWITLLVFGR